MKYTIELSKEQMLLVAYCLEDVSRFASGQPNMDYTLQHMLKELPFDITMERRNHVRDLLELCKKILLPELSANESLGYNSTTFIGNTYQIYRSIIHQVAVDEDWHNVYSSPTLPSGNMGGIKITKVEE
jgi:hypothetical protein